MIVLLESDCKWCLRNAGLEIKSANRVVIHDAFRMNAVFVHCDLSMYIRGVT